MRFDAYKRSWLKEGDRGRTKQGLKQNPVVLHMYCTCSRDGGKISNATEKIYFLKIG